MKADEIKMEVGTQPIEIPILRSKKTRRGKKRRHNSYEDAENPSHSPPPNTSLFRDESFEIHEIEKRSKTNVVDLTPEGAAVGSVPCNGGSFKRLMLRPLDVPKAPNNSTTFIIDDHENCNLYLSFESPRRRRSSGSEGGYSPCTGYRDIDYEYESPDDLNTKAFMEKEFETTYRKAREDELVTLSRSALVEMFIEIEDRVSSYELLLKDGVPSLAHLHKALLILQEENTVLRKTNMRLKSGLASISTDSDVGESDLCSSMEESETCAQRNLDGEGTRLDLSVDP